MLVFISCKSQEAREEISVVPIMISKTDYPPFDQSEYQLSFKLIPLETSDQSLIRPFDLMRVSKEYFATLNLLGRDLSVFRRNGKYVFSVPLGRAQNEVFSPTNMLINEEKGLLEVFDYTTRRITQYDLEGKYINTVGEIMTHMNMEFSSIGNSWVFYNCGLGGSSNPDFFTIVTPLYGDSLVHRTFLKKSGYLGSVHSLLGGQFERYKDTLFFNAYYNDIIYAITTDDNEPFPAYRVNDVYHEESVFDNKESFKEHCNKRFFQSFSGLRILDNGNLWAFSVTTGTSNLSLFWDKSKNKIYSSPFGSYSGWWGMILYASDGESSYHQFMPSQINEIDRDKIQPSTRPLYDMIKDRVDKSEMEENPYIIEVSYKRR